MLRSARSCALALLVVTLACQATDPQDPFVRGPAGAPLESLSGLGSGFVVWESNRSGYWRIWTRQLDGSGLRQLSADEADRDHFAAHVSPDGTRVAYLSHPEGVTSYRSRVARGVPIELRVIDLGSGEERTVAEDARAYGQSRSVVWLDGHRLVYVTRRNVTRELDLRTGATLDLARGPEPFLLNPQKTHGTGNDPYFSPFDAAAGAYHPSPKRAGCQSYFTRDGRFGFWNARSGGPVIRMDLASERNETIIEADDPRLPEGYRHVYFTMISPDQRLLAYGASSGDHDHFSADYEVFVVPIDPMTLELVGEPVRITHDPSVDRFPDVFVEGLELGHLGGEVPFEVAIDPAQLRAASDAGGPWTFRFGDGNESVAAIGRHRYTEPGRYLLEAERDGELLRARVDVEGSAPPVALRSIARDSWMEVVFDEPIDPEAVRARFVSGTEVQAVEVAPDRHTLIVRYGGILPAEDELALSGVRDLAGHESAPLTLDVERASWPSRSDGLVFRFETANADNRIDDPASGRRIGFPVEPRGRARTDHAGALQLADGSFEVGGVGPVIAEQCADGDAITIEAVLHPVELGNREPRTWFSLENESRRWLVTLSQKGEDLRARFRTDDRDPEIPVAVVEGDEPIHLVVSYAGDRVVAYANGQKSIDSDRVRGRMDRLPQAERLTLGSNSRGEADWPGKLEGLAVYCRAMGDAEAEANAQAVAMRLRERAPVRRDRVFGRLVAVSHAPSLDEIAPYREALALYEWEVLRVADGELGERRVRVAHWAVLGGRSQDASSLRLGAERWLDLEPLDENPQVAELVLSDELPVAPEVPVFLDVGP